ncbi:hypothetical protein [Granulicella sp. WH15]|nr:hypothetical protein [Granulicella sp. WH15]
MTTKKTGNGNNVLTPERFVLYPNGRNFVRFWTLRMGVFSVN